VHLTVHEGAAHNVPTPPARTCLSNGVIDARHQLLLRCLQPPQLLQARVGRLQRSHPLQPVLCCPRLQAVQQRAAQAELLR
jgi:hypothetical protein